MGRVLDFPPNGSQFKYGSQSVGDPTPCLLSNGSNRPDREENVGVIALLTILVCLLSSVHYVRNSLFSVIIFNLIVHCFSHTFKFAAGGDI